MIKNVTSSAQMVPLMRNFNNILSNYDILFQRDPFLYFLNQPFKYDWSQNGLLIA